MLVSARIHLLLNHSWFGSLVTRLVLIDATKWCDTAATDGYHLFYNREFIKSLDPEQVIFLLGHEILHAVLEHVVRGRGLDHDYANMAADYVVNAILIKERIGKMPPIALYDKKYEDMSFEEVYEHLLKTLPPKLKILDQHIDFAEQDDMKTLFNDQSDDNNIDNVNDSNCVQNQKNKNVDPGTETGVDYTQQPPSYTREQLEQIANVLKNAVINATQSNSGNTPGFCKRLIEDLLEPKLDWRQILERKIQSYVKEDFTFTRPNKKGMANNLILPGLNISRTINVAVSLDTSGSISEQYIREFLTETRGLLDCFEDFTVHVWCIDTVVMNYKIFTRDNIDEIDYYERYGNGGNDFPANWQFMEKEQINPDVLLVFSDGYPCGSWGDPDYCDTIFLIKNTHDKSIEAPFGLTIYMED